MYSEVDTCVSYVWLSGKYKYKYKYKYEYKYKYKYEYKYKYKYRYKYKFHEVNLRAPITLLVTVQLSLRHLFGCI